MRPRRRGFWAAAIHGWPLTRQMNSAAVGIRPKTALTCHSPSTRVGTGGDEPSVRTTPNRCSASKMPKLWWRIVRCRWSVNHVAVSKNHWWTGRTTGGVVANHRALLSASSSAVGIVVNSGILERSMYWSQSAADGMMLISSTKCCKEIVSTATDVPSVFAT